ncbi:MAG TPA: translocation/assembly module TamB domain-containing protein, partial [Prolixibacteraceae bacterium]|nr:translocation/assembly module TamB domain-containing protein [Prolixibacteraceae bacterium]
KKIKAGIDSLNRKSQNLRLNDVKFEGSKINLKKLENNRFNFRFLIDSLRSPQKEPGQWKIRVNHFAFNNSNILYADLANDKTKRFTVNDLNFDVSNFKGTKEAFDFQINQLSLNDGKNLQVHNLNAFFHSAGDSVIINDLNIGTNYSAIGNSRLKFKFPEDDKSLEQMQIDFNFYHSIISFRDLAMLIPTLEGMEQVIDLSGNIYGTVNDLKGRNLLLRTGEKTLAEFDLYVNDVTTPQSMYLFLDLKNFQTTFYDISNIKLPANSDSDYLNFPKSFYDAGILRYKGNFTGFLTDFVAYGTLTSNMGSLTTDVSLVPQNAGSISYEGKIATQSFKLGQLFKNENLGTVTFNGSVDGRLNRTHKTISGKYQGKIAQLEVNSYNYQNIQIDGRIDSKRFDGVFSINDPNLKFDFIGQVNLNPEVPEFDFQLNVLNAKPGNLNMGSKFPNAETSFFMLANFKGSSIDNLEGKIEVQNGTYTNRNGRLNLKGMELNSEPGKNENVLTFNSDFFDFQVEGIYHFSSLADAFKKSFNRYLPALNYETIANAEKNKFKYQIEAKELDSLMAVFAPGLYFQTPFFLYGALNSEKSVFELEGSIPAFSTDNILAKDIFIGNGPEDGLFKSKFRLGEIMLKNGMKLYNMSIESKILDNKIQNQISWTNFHRLTYSGRIITEAVFTDSGNSKYPNIQIEGFPTKVYMADSLWQIAPFTASIDSNSFKINNFKLYSDKQEITVNGTVSDDPNSKLTADFQNINLWYLDEYMNKEFSLGGTLDGSAGIADFYNERYIFSDLTIEDFVFKDQVIGRVSLTNDWNYFESIVDSKITINKNERESLTAHGNYNPATKNLDYNLSADRLSLVFLDPLLKKIFSQIHGNASGDVRIYGTPDKVLFYGELLADNAGLTIDYTQVKYNFSDSVYFQGDTIRFDQINIVDEKGNQGIFDGTIVHQNFKKMQYDLSVQTRKILAYNTTPKLNDQFFGQIVASGRLDINGRGSQVYLNGTGKTLAGTNVNISLESEGKVEKYDFIRFVSQVEKEKEEFKFAPQKTGDFNLKLNIHATPDARVQLIYNSQIGDVIKAQGEGFLNFEINNEGEILLSGDYTVEKGDYLFTLQNVINKRFDIEQGGSIIWSGDPYNAIIDINAVYRLKASVYDMLEVSYNEVSANSRIPVECKILLSQNLMNPEIEFEINFPTVDSYLTSQLRQYFNTPEEMNRQILSLLVLGKFYVPEYMRGSYQAQNPNLIGTTASELFSNQLSNWLSQINNNVDVGFNYRPGNQITDDEIELALSTQIFNDRVTLNGNIGNNVNPYTGNNSQLVGDFEVNVKLIPSGKLQLKAYNRSNNNLIYETSPYTQGVGFSFTEEYNTLGDLWRKMGSIIGIKSDNN